MPNELTHHGIRGQKWGVRRFQNKDGSLTNAGKKRYDNDNNDLATKKAAYKTAKKEYNKSFDKAYNRAIAAWSPIKKHREANDARWEDAINKADAFIKAKSEYETTKKAVKAEKKAFKEDVKYAKKNGLTVEYDKDKFGNVNIKQFYDSKGAKIGKDYAMKVMATVDKENANAAKRKKAIATASMASAYVATAAVVGAGVVSALLNE